MKSRDKQKLGIRWGWVIFLIIVVSGGLWGVIYIYSQEVKTNNNDCLTNFAKSYCEEQNRTFKGTYWEFEPKFLCYGENRKGSSQESFYFLDEEVEECLG